MRIDTKIETDELYNLIHMAWAKGYDGIDLRPYFGPITLLAQKKLDSWQPPLIGEDALFQVIDFFSGCGGMSLGFAAISKILPFFEVIGGCDINADALLTFETNHNAPGIRRDIRELSVDDDELSQFMGKLVRRNEEKPLVVIGCAPCQGFTSHRKKNWSEDDHRNSLVGAFASLAIKLSPECIVMENVPEMLGKKYWSHFIEAKEIFETAGYIVKQSIYNAASFGTPQERFRAIVIAHKKNFLLPRPILGTDDYVTVRDAISDLPAVEPGEINSEDPYHRCARHRKSTLETIRKIPHNGGSRPEGVGPKCLDRIRGFYDVYGRLYWDKPAITITHYARNPASGRYVHPDQDRGLTMREAARLQSFPDGFKFCGTFDSVFKQIGEAVPPRLACGVATNVLIELLALSPPVDDEEQSGIKPITKPVSSSYSSVIAGMKMKREKKIISYTCVDAFSGAGGLSLGLSDAEYEILLSFDNDSKCIATQKLNPKYLPHQAMKADVVEMRNGKLLNILGLEPGELFLLAGGPPCQGFSIQRIGPDEDERNSLIMQYMLLMTEIMPHYFLMENVPGIVGKRGKTLLKEALKIAEKAGYHIHQSLLDAQDYGVPQRRKRIFIIGERVDGVEANFQFPPPVTLGNDRIKVGEVIGHLPPPPEDGTDHPDIPNHRRDRLSKLNQDRLRALEPGQGREYLPPKLLAKCHQKDASIIGHRNVYGRMAWNEVSPTITARFDSFTRGQFGHPEQNRSISLREGALLQTFPVDFAFEGTKVDIARQIGNAVPPTLAKELGKQIIKCHKEKLQKHKDLLL